MSDAPARARIEPFPGLRPFRTDEHHLFFGREDQTAALLTLLRKQRFLSIVGTSGSGKSSLVRAGMIPALHRGAMAGVGSHWEVVVLRPGGQPLRNLARALLEADLYDATDAETLPRLSATLARSGSGLVEAVRQSDALTPQTRLLVVVDQFEELFRFRQRDAGAGDEATAFVNLLLTATEQSEQVYVAITMRSDYLGDCSTIAGLAEAVNRGEYLIPRLSRDQRRDAIVQPVGVGGGTIAPRLVQRMLNEVGDDPDQLPVLQHALMRTWEVWTARGDRARPIDLEDFEATGGMAEALSRHADEVYAALPDDAHRHACERAYRALTERSADGRGIRRPASVANLAAVIGAERAALVVVLDAFRAPGVTLLMPGVDRELADRTVIDLSHESLMRCWGRLRGWVDDEARSARIYRRVSDTARLWSEGGAGLFQDPDLAIAVSWREKERPTAAWAQQYGGDFDLSMRFVDESRAKALAVERERESARQRDLEQAQRLAEEQRLRLEEGRLRLEEQRLASLRLGRILRGLAAVALLAVGTSVIAGKFWRDASAARKEAESSAESARNNATLASQNATTAQTEAQRANEQKRLAETNVVKAEEAEKLARQAEGAAREAEAAGRRLLYATDMQLAPFVWEDRRSSAGQLAARLEVHDPSKNEGAAGKEDLRGFEWHYYRHVLESASTAYAHADGVLGVALTADERVVTLDARGRLRLWSPETNRATELPGTVDDGAAPLGRVSADGRLAAAASGSRLLLLDAATGAELRRLELGQDRIASLDISSDGRRLAVLAANQLQWFDTGSGEKTAAVALDFDLSSRDAHVALSADGLSAVVGPYGPVGQFVSVFRLDAAGRRIERTGVVGERGTLRGFALSPDGTLVAVGGWFGSLVTVYESATNKQVAANEAEHASPVSALAFSRDGAQLATGALDGAIKVWSDPRELKPLRTLKGHDDAVSGLAFSADARGLVSAGFGGTVRRWDLSAPGAAVRSLSPWRTKESAKSPHASMEPVFSPDGLFIAVADDSRVMLLDAWSARPVRVLAEDRGAVLSVAISPDNRLLAVGRISDPEAPYPFRPSTVALWDIDTGKLVSDLGGIDSVEVQHEAYSNADALAFTPDGRFLVAGFGGRGHHFSPAGSDILRIWEVATGRRFDPRGRPGPGCVSIAFSADGCRMATCSHDGTARIWDAKTWSVLRLLAPPGGQSLEDVAFSPDGRLLAIASFDSTITFWDVETGALRTTLSGHSSAVQRVAFSPDGRTLASGSGDGTIRFWNLPTSTQLMVLRTDGLALGRQMDSVSFAPDGTQLAAAGGRSAAVWSAARSPWDDPPRAALALERLLASKADFRSRVRMLSEELRLHEALAVLAGRSDDPLVSAALSAARANWHAMHGEWSEACRQFDRVASDAPATWLGSSGLLRVATALVHEGRPAAAAALLAGGAARRDQDGLPKVADAAADPSVAALLLLTDERLAARPRDAGLLELRAELAGQWSGVAAQIADFSAAIDALSGLADEESKASLARVLRRRGGALLATQAWQRASDDLSRIVAAGPGDSDLFALRARAYEGLGDWAAAAGDWMRAASPGVAGARLLAGFGDRVRAAGRPDLAVGPYDAAQRWYEEALADGTGRPDVARELASLLVHRIPEPAWTVLRPEEMTSTAGTKQTALPDGSVLAVGEPSEKDVCSVVFAPGAGPIRALRIEALPDPSLPDRGPGRFGGSFSVELALLSGNAPVPLRDVVVTDADRGLEHPAGPSATAVHWRALNHFAQGSVALFSAEVGQTAAERLRLEIRTGPIPRQDLGRFRLSISDAPENFDRERRRLSAARLTRPWAKLAAAYWALGDDAAVDRIAARGPDAAVQVGDLFAADREWERAIGCYDRALATAPDDGVALAGRAAAHAGAGRSERAEADWLLAVGDQPRLRQAAFGSLTLTGRFPAAARVCRTLVEENPSDLQEWLRAAPAMALAGDRAAYVEFVGRMAQRFGASPDRSGEEEWIAASSLCRAGALLPDAYDLDLLPGDLDARCLDAGLVNDRRSAWGWATRALLELRKGDAAAALRHLQRAQSSERMLDPLDVSFVSAVRSLTHHALGDDAAARADLQTAERIIDSNLSRDTFALSWHQSDRLTPLVLVKEAHRLLGE